MKHKLDSSLNSDLSNYRQSEIDATRRSAELLQRAAATPELVMANFARFVRFQDVSRFLVMNEVFQKILHVHGSIVELGVLNGANLFNLGHLCEIYEPRNYTRRIYGFDTFEGYTDLKETVDGGVAQEGYTDSYATVDYPHLLEAVDNFNQSIQFNQFKKMELIKGDGSVTVPKFVEDHPELIVSLLLCQTDIYQPTVDTLNALMPRIPKGGVVLFCALNDQVAPGETLALNEVVGLENCRLQRFSFSTKVSYYVKE